MKGSGNSRADRDEAIAKETTAHAGSGRRTSKEQKIRSEVHKDHSSGADGVIISSLIVSESSASLGVCCAVYNA